MSTGRASTSLSGLFGKISVPCILLGLLFFAASLTPSLLPRGPVVQGILGGLVMAIGYLIGHIVALLWRAAEFPLLSGRPANVVVAVVSIPLVAFFIWVLASSLAWQNDICAKMGIELADGLNLVTIVIIAGVVITLCYLLGRLIASLYRLIRGWFYGVMPPRRANVLGVITVVVILFVATRDGIFSRVVEGLDASYEAAQQLFQDARRPRPSRA